MRAILYIVLAVVVYQALKVIFRSTMTAYKTGGQPARRVPGEEMVQDPQCRTYVVKGRALSRRVAGSTVYFCSAGCADAYERDHRPR